MEESDELDSICSDNDGKSAKVNYFQCFEKFIQKIIRGISRPKNKSIIK
jgi:hypothetical protein